MLFLLIGFAAGVRSGRFGIGGGVVIVPALGAWVYWKDGNIDLRAAGFIALGLALGGFFGAKLVQRIDATTLRKLLAVFLAGVAVRVWFS